MAEDLEIPVVDIPDDDDLDDEISAEIDAELDALLDDDDLGDRPDLEGNSSAMAVQLYRAETERLRLYCETDNASQEIEANAYELRTERMRAQAEVDAQGENSRNGVYHLRTERLGQLMEVAGQLFPHAVDAGEESWRGHGEFDPFEYIKDPAVKKAFSLMCIDVCSAIGKIAKES